MTLEQVAISLQDLINKELNKIEIERQKLLQLKSENESMQSKISTVFSGDKIKLDVGGKIFSASKSTLCSKPNSFFGVMLSGKYKLIPDENGCYFIDRNPASFEIILDYLRGYEIDLSNIDKRTLQILKQDAEFYNLVELIQLLINNVNDINYCFQNNIKEALIKSDYVVNKGTLLTNGIHHWKVRIDNVVPSTDVGIVKEEHQSHFITGAKSAWGLREQGIAYYENKFTGMTFKNGDVIDFYLDLNEKKFSYKINGGNIAFTHQNIIAPVHIAFSGGANAKATIIE